MREVFVHIGYPKTSTTYLQTNIFNNFNKSKIDFVNECKILTENILQKDVNFIDIKNIHEELKLDKRNKLLISHEGLIGNVYFGGLNYFSNAIKLKKIFGENLKIIISIRKQDELLHSIYKYYIFCGGTDNFKRFVRPKLNFQSVTNHFDINSLKFYELITMYEEIFKRENIHVFLYEEFKNNKNKVISDICKFLKVEAPNIENEKIVNSSIKSGLFIFTFRFINKFLIGMGKNSSLINSYGLYLRVILRKIDNILFFLPKFKTDFSIVRNREEIYSSNLKLQKYLKKNLGKYNYPLSDK